MGIHLEIQKGLVGWGGGSSMKKQENKCRNKSKTNGGRQESRVRQRDNNLKRARDRERQTRMEGYRTAALMLYTAHLPHSNLGVDGMNDAIQLIEQHVDQLKQTKPRKNGKESCPVPV